MMGLNLDVESMSYLTATEEPETERELGLVIFPKTMTEALQKHEISQIRGTSNSTTKLLCSIKELSFDKGIYGKQKSKIFSSLCGKSIHLSGPGHNTHFVMTTVTVRYYYRVNNSVHGIHSNTRGQQKYSGSALADFKPPNSLSPSGQVEAWYLIYIEPEKRLFARKYHSLTEDSLLNIITMVWLHFCS